MRIDFEAPQNVRDVIASLQRTEDVRFSPDNRRLAVAGFIKNKIAVFDISIVAHEKSKRIALTDVKEYSSPYLNFAHGLDFIDEKTIIVANREGQVCIFALPENRANTQELTLLAILHSDKVFTPGSVAVIKKERGFCDVLVCNNYAHRVTRHQLDLGSGYSIKNNQVLFKRWLNIPDGISVSNEMQWIAVSNHSTHTVLLYKNGPSLSTSSAPDGILRQTGYPHGVRFTSDGRFILVADAGAPHVNIYKNDWSEWRGVRDPLLSVKVLSDDDFLRGRHNKEEGGPKGVDINNDMDVFVTTCETQPLAFFDLRSILESQLPEAQNAGSIPAGSKAWLRIQKTLKVRHELYRWRVADILRRFGRKLWPFPSRVPSF